MTDDSEVYTTIAILTGVVVFIGSWIYCINEYGFLIGVGVGWIPSIIVAGIAAALWPIFWLGVALMAVMSMG